MDRLFPMFPPRHLLDGGRSGYPVGPTATNPSLERVRVRGGRRDRTTLPVREQWRTVKVHCALWGTGTRGFVTPRPQSCRRRDRRDSRVNTVVPVRRRTPTPSTHRSGSEWRGRGSGTGVDRATSSGARVTPETGHEGTSRLLHHRAHGPSVECDPMYLLVPKWLG